MKFESAAILDFYVDEPSCLGVPPYLATYPRYVAGALRCNGVKDILYRTVDEVRRDLSLLEAFSKRDLFIGIGGIAVPGKYIGGTPAGPGEIASMASRIRGPVKVFGGPLARFGFGMTGGRLAELLPEEAFDLVVRGDIEGAVADLVAGGSVEGVDPDRWVPRRDLGKWAAEGAAILPQHPDMPDTLCELETYRGCLWRKCAFCVEPQYGVPDFRPVEDIAAEVAALHRAGAVRFRLGDQPDLFAYGAEGLKSEDARPDPEALRKLYRAVRAAAPGLRTLHMDNADPAFIAEHPEEGREAARVIAEHNTGGDVAAFGGETADPRVVKANHLHALPEQVLEAVRILNGAGAARDSNGMPKLLPGLNFVFGLQGETGETYRLNFDFLKRVLDAGLMVRRINLRQVAPMKGTPMWKVGDRVMRRHHGLFKRWKERIRSEIDRPMLRRVVPPGTVLRDIRLELHENGLTFGRQLGSYPLLVGMPGRLPLRSHTDAVICDHGMRSVTGVALPVDLNRAPLKTLAMLPGVGAKRAARLAAGRPLALASDVAEALDDPNLAERVAGWGRLS